MAVEYTLLMQRTTAGSEVKSSLSDFGFAVNEIPWPDEETEDVNTREWPGVDGEDAYIPPSGLRLKAYNIEVEFVCAGGINTANTLYEALRDYLAGGMLKVYDPYWKRGRQNVYLKKLSDLEPFRTNIDEGMSVKATFRVTDPRTKITLAYVGD